MAKKAANSDHATKAGTTSLVLGATGVVFGDIGTSPIYAFKETVHASGSSAESIFGVTSLFFWTLIIVVTIKYLTFVMRADNRGEGGILALLSLMPTNISSAEISEIIMRLLFLVLVGTALLFGDGVLTPLLVCFLPPKD